MRRLVNWWFEPAPVGRVAVLRLLAYGFIPLDVLFFTKWIDQHRDVPTELYQPLIIGRILHLPMPTYAFVEVMKWLTIITALAAMTGRLPRLFGYAAFACYLEWMIIGMSYGKVDHDRFSFLVALAVLPSVGRAFAADRTPSARAGWALRMIQVSVMLTYFLSSWAKIRFGGWDWATGATFARAILRRGTVLSDWLLQYPDLLIVGQWLMIGAELLSPLILLARTDRAKIIVATGLLAFHLMVFSTITIIFLPHLIAIASFLPGERLFVRRQSDQDSRGERSSGRLIRFARTFRAAEPEPTPDRA